MRHVRMLTMMAFAVCALAALGASSASAALPEWGACEADPGHGQYGDASCTAPVKKVDGQYKGDYEWYGGQTLNAFNEHVSIAGYNYKHGAIGPTTFETTNGKKIQCSEGELYQLQIRGPKNVGKILPFFYGCESEGQVCSSEFAEYGSINDEQQWGLGEALKGELVYVSGKNTGTPTVGLTLEPYNAGTPLFTVICEGELGSVRIGGAGGSGKHEQAKGDAVISLIEPVDQMTKEYTQTFSQTAGVQNPDKAQKGKPISLQEYLSNENRWFQSGLSSTFQDIAGGGLPPVEIKAIK